MTENNIGGTVYMPSYTIKAVTPKLGGTHRLAKYVGKSVHIYNLTEGENCFLMLDDDKWGNGLHLTRTEHISGRIGDEEIQILTRNTMYILKKNH